MKIRLIKPDDLVDITANNQGIEERIATLEQSPKTVDDVRDWLIEREDRYRVLVAVEGSEVVGWAAINPYSHR